MTEPVKKPNIILITTDQQRWDSCGPAAPPWMRTPHFDLLCREGIRFDSAYTECPLCVPARVTLMTGKHPWTHGMTTNGSSTKAMGREGTLPTRLRELGYQTAAIGKMHFTPERARHGFDELIIPDDYYKEMARSGSPLQPMRHGLGQNELYPTLATVPESQTLTSWIAERCVDYVLERRDPTTPFFLWCSFPKPHPPLDPPEPYYSMYRGCDIPKPAIGDWASKERAPFVLNLSRVNMNYDLVPPEIIREARAAYLGLITQNDYNMGRLFEALQDAGLLDDAMLVYTSDHGELLGDHHTGGKSFFFEGSAHVPMAVRLPKSWERRMPGSGVRTPVCLADVLPTIVRAAGGEVGGVDGLDMTALARGEISRPRRFVECTSNCGGSPAFWGITDGRWKYTWFFEGPGETLFDLSSDPYEKVDLSRSKVHAPKTEEMRAEAARLLAARGSNLVEGGRLITRSVRETDEATLRSTSWPGFHTERCDVDVRH